MFLFDSRKGKTATAFRRYRIHQGASLVDPAQSSFSKRVDVVEVRQERWGSKPYQLEFQGL
jgi:hypothetical protein